MASTESNRSLVHPLVARIARSCVLALIYGILLSGEAFSAPDEAKKGFDSGEWPAKCHSLGRSEALLEESEIKSTNDAKYANVANAFKRDIVCIGDDVIIDHPIFSNGGDIVVLADRLTIKGKLDTRIYRPFVLANLFADKDPDCQATSCLNTLPILSEAPEFNKAYLDYYSCEECRILGRAEYVARMPDGLVGMIPWGDANRRDIPGKKPPAIAGELFRSGTIYIFANKIDVDQSVPAPALIADGLPGGVGGAGQPTSCIHWHGNTTSCITGTISGLNSPGGDGGDAGDVFVFSSKNNLTQEFLDRYSSAKPGSRGPSTKFRSPSFASSVKGNKTDFHQEGTWPDAKLGQSGETKIVRVDAVDMFRRFFDLVAAKDAFASYDLQEYAGRVQYDRSQAFTSFSAYVGSRLADVYTDRLMAVLRDALFHFDFTKQPKATQSTLLLCKARGLENAPTEVQDVLSRIAATCEDDGRVKTFGDYLRGIGGAFNFKSRDIAQRVESENIGLSVSEGQVAWENIIASLQDLEKLQIDALVSSEKTRIYAQTRDLQERIDSLTKELNAQSPGDAFGQFVKLVSAAGQLGSSVSLFYRALDEYNGTKKGLEEIHKRAGAIPEDYGKLAASLTLPAQSGSSIEQQIEADRKSISELEDELNKFLLGMAAFRADVTANKASQLQNVISARVRYLSRLNARVSNYDDYLRAIILTYLSDASRDRSVLEINLRGMVSYVSEFPSHYPRTMLTSANDHCGSDPSGSFCKVWSRSSTDQEVGLCARVRSDLSVYLPLYVISAGTDRLFLNTYGIDQDALLASRLGSKEPEDKCGGQK